MRGFDPLGESRKGPAPALAERSENSPEEKANVLECEVHSLIEKSATAALKGDTVEALDLAKDAVSDEFVEYL